MRCKFKKAFIAGLLSLVTVKLVAMSPEQACETYLDAADAYVKTEKQAVELMRALAKDVEPRDGIIDLVEAAYRYTPYLGAQNLERAIGIVESAIDIAPVKAAVFSVDPRADLVRLHRALLQRRQRASRGFALSMEERTEAESRLGISARLGKLPNDFERLSLLLELVQAGRNSPGFSDAEWRLLVEQAHMLVKYDLDQAWGRSPETGKFFLTSMALYGTSFNSKVDELFQLISSR